MKSLAFTKKLEARLGNQRVEDPLWYERAMCKGADWENFEIGADEVPEVMYRAMKFCVVCPVRRDCVVDALVKADRGVIRGGVKFTDKMHNKRCRVCQLPVTERGKRCSFCSMRRECSDCHVAFTARHYWLRVDRCNDCQAGYLRLKNQEQILRVPARRVRKPS